VPDRVPLLEYMDEAPRDRRVHVCSVLEKHEARAAKTCRLRDGAAELLRALRGRGLKLGLLTRNSRASADTVVERFALAFDCCITREEAAPKPSPAPVLTMARHFGFEPFELLVVGDYIFDIEAGRAAGARTAFLKTHDGVEPPPADIYLGKLSDLLDCF